MPWAELLKQLGPLVVKWLKKKKQSHKERILVVGAGGVGKSTLGELLQSSMSVLSVRTKYEESFGTEIFSVTGDIKADVFVVAGQAHRRNATWDELLDDVQNGEMTGVILVNAFGYHSIGPVGVMGEANYSKLKSEGKEDDFLDEYLNLKRDEELKVLKHILPHLRARKNGKLWLLSVLTKEDLWFDDYDEVWQHYASGEYNSLIEDIKKSLGANSFRHELVTMSLLMKDFITERNELLASSSQNYKQEKQVESFKRFFETLSSLC